MSSRYRLLSVAVAAAMLGFLYVISLGNYLLFHSIAEAFSIVIAFCIFILAWNSRRLMENGYLLFLGIAYLFVGGIDFLHTLAYSGMNVFEEPTTNLATQLWLAARFMESLSILLAPLFLGRRLRVEGVLLGYAAASFLFLGSIFYWDAFPTCFVEGQGLTAFKKLSEYAISIVLLASAAALWMKRSYFEPGILRLLIASIALTIASELAFTFYIHAYGFSNLVGHFFKIVSFYLIYKALIETGLRRPYDLLFRELKQREAALAESEAAYRAIFENTGTATLIVRADTTVTLVNTEFEALSGYSKEEVEDKMSWRAFVVRDDLERMQQYHDGRRSGVADIPKQYDFRMRCRDGTERDVHMTVSMIPGTTDSVASAMDITDRKRAEEIIRRDKETLETIVRQRTDELLEAHRRLEDARRLSGIGTLAATVAHELRNPLGVIRTAILNIRRKSGDPDLDKHLKNIETKIAESDQIINNLLRYSNIRPPTRERTSLHRILLECIAEAEKRFPDNPAELAASLGSIEDLAVDADPVQMKEVFGNILNNAYQALENSGGHVEVCASLEPEGAIRVEVRDDGAGMDAETLEMVFEPFYTTRARGTGLGLAITRELVRLHGGTVTIESAPGSGTTVAVVLKTGEVSGPRAP